jgi:DNA invertase Pin-like site-specific DNA recombinase
MTFGRPERHPLAPQRAGKREVSSQVRTLIINELNEFANDGPIPHGSKAYVAKKFGVSRTTVFRIWDRYGACGRDLTEATRRRNTNRPRRPKYDPDEIAQRIKNLPLEQCRTVRDVCTALDISSMVLYRLLKRQAIKRVSARFRPKLTEQHNKPTLNKQLLDLTMKKYTTSSTM